MEVLLQIHPCFFSHSIKRVLPLSAVTVSPHHHTVAQPAQTYFGGPKCPILGEQQYVVWDGASQSTK